MNDASRSADLPDVLAFMQGLWAVVHRMERLSKQMAASGGVTGPQRLVLRLIELFPGLSAGDLAALLHLHPSTLTGVLKRLQAQRLIARTADPSDRRRTMLRLTPLGARASALRTGTVEAAVTATFGRASPSEREATRTFLDELARCLDHEIAAATRP